MLYKHIRSPAGIRPKSEANVNNPKLQFYSSRCSSFRTTIMPRSNETEWWVNAVYETIMKIPYGRVTTYKHIAELLETRKCYIRMS